MMPNTLCVNGGGVLRTAGGLRFVNPALHGAKYCNAQIDDYQGLPRRFSTPAAAAAGAARTLLAS